MSALATATARLIATVSGLSHDDLAAPSLLPSWSRAHVVAHLALNAEGLAGAVHGVTTGRAVTMYASPAARDDDIAALAAGDGSVVVARLTAAADALAAALQALPPDLHGTAIERTPGSGPSYTAGDVASMRLREVEIHHADLGAGYHPSNWSADFAADLVESIVAKPSALAFTIRAVDVGRAWHAGPINPSGSTPPVVSGTAADLGWWLTGRGDDDRLTSDNGELPRIEAW